ncbi:hypothetical protein [Flammeovirga sp. EKP202]|uniref:hypothetical protein n=1 Tax=Flammeovirga sp. EKP202 TaxID=2770592 RepID=UPI00165EFD22|nr:hypothetical protein [Flammeovirga sp. EKP202]MBD0403223.1 hypothetical protein [Flammeovirga sp. EKP202]
MIKDQKVIEPDIEVIDDGKHRIAPDTERALYSVFGGVLGQAVGKAFGAKSNLPMLFGTAAGHIFYDYDRRGLYKKKMQNFVDELEKKGLKLTKVGQ